MMQKSLLATGGICLCSSFYSREDKKSGCCYTPDIEPGSLTHREDHMVIDLNKTSLLSSDGDAVYADNPDKELKIIVIRKKHKEFYALSRLCTHGGQALSFIPERGLLQCNSFNHSLFELDGRVWKGPAPDPIITYKTKLSGNELNIYY